MAETRSLSRVPVQQNSRHSLLRETCYGSDFWIPCCHPASAASWGDFGQWHCGPDGACTRQKPPWSRPPARGVCAVSALCRVIPAKVRDRVVDQGLQSSLPSREVARGLSPISGPRKADRLPAALLAGREG